ncbi:hypothetical protein MASR1M50_09230 [Burkholderiales bacterium]|jgi:hypothetical protein
MYTPLRLIALALPTLLFWAAWHVLPELLEPVSLRWFSGIVTVLWALEFYFYQRLSGLSGLPGLSSKERDRLLFRLSDIRWRVWRIGTLGLVCSIALWVLAALNLPASSSLYAALAGFLVGVSLSYLALIPRWLDEVQRFQDEVQRQHMVEQERAELLKTLNGT